MTAPTRALVAELNTRARNDRLTGLDEKEIGRILTLADGTHAGVHAQEKNSNGSSICSPRRNRPTRAGSCPGKNRSVLVSISATGHQKKPR